MPNKTHKDSRYYEMMEASAKNIIEWAVNQYNGQVYAAAEFLGVTPAFLYRKARQVGAEVEIKEIRKPRRTKRPKP
jgi:DNA-binding NtrC family response regulator